MSYVYRAARMVDTMQIVDILDARQADSCYADSVPVDKPYARKLIAGLIGRNGGTKEGAAFVHVAVKDSGVVAFVAASLGRVYSIGVKLAACDHFLVGYKDVPAPVLDRLLAAYIAWAEANPLVHEIGASWSDAIPGSNRFDPAFRRRGFSPCATTYRKLRADRVEIAA